MKARRNPAGAILILALLGGGASFVGYAAPRPAQNPALPGDGAIPTATWVTSVGVVPSGVASSDLSAQAGAPRPNRTSDGRGVVAATPAPRPRPTAGPSPKVAAASPRRVARRPVPAAATRPPASLAGVGGHLLSGLSSWYCSPGRSACTAGFPASGLYAAAGPAVRAAIGPSWRGTVVTVTTSRASVRVRLVDWCACGGGRLLDLYASVFSGSPEQPGLGVPLSAGVVDVRVSW